MSKRIIEDRFFCIDLTDAGHCERVYSPPPRGAFPPIDRLENIQTKNDSVDFLLPKKSQLSDSKHQETIKDFSVVQCPYSSFRMSRQAFIHALLFAFFEFESNGIVHTHASNKTVMFGYDGKGKRKVYFTETKQICYADKICDLLSRNADRYEADSFWMAPELRQYVRAVRNHEGVSFHADIVNRSGNAINVYSLAHLLYYYFTGLTSPDCSFEAFLSEGEMHKLLIDMTKKEYAERPFLRGENGIYAKVSKFIGDKDLAFILPLGFRFSVIEENATHEEARVESPAREASVGKISEVLDYVAGDSLSEPDKEEVAPAVKSTEIRVSATSSETRFTVTPIRVDPRERRLEFERALRIAKNNPAFKKYLSDDIVRFYDPEKFRLWEQKLDEYVNRVDEKFNRIKNEPSSAKLANANRDHIANIKYCVESICRRIEDPSESSCNEAELAALEANLDKALELYRSFIYGIDLTPNEFPLSADVFVCRIIELADKAKQDEYIDSVIPPAFRGDFKILRTAINNDQQSKMRLYELCPSDKVAVVFGRFLNNEKNAEHFDSLSAVINELAKHTGISDAVCESGTAKIKEFIQTYYSL